MPPLTSLAALAHQATPAIPPTAWPVAYLIFALLALAAIIDAFTARIPDPIIFLGLFITTAAQGLFASWNNAASHLREAIATAFIIWLINALWHRLTNRDALGMGDAKWTMLAVASFGIMPSLFAWGTGALLTTPLICAAHLTRRKSPHIAFAPFLLIGLCFGIYKLRLITPL